MNVSIFYAFRDFSKIFFLRLKMSKTSQIQKAYNVSYWKLSVIFHSRVFIQAFTQYYLFPFLTSSILTLTVRLILFQPFVDTLTDPSVITFVRAVTKNYSNLNASITTHVHLNELEKKNKQREIKIQFFEIKRAFKLNRETELQKQKYMTTYTSH